MTIEEVLDKTHHGGIIGSGSLGWRAQGTPKTSAGPWDVATPASASNRTTSSGRLWTREDLLRDLGQPETLEPFDVLARAFNDGRG